MDKGVGVVEELCLFEIGGAQLRALEPVGADLAGAASDLSSSSSSASTRRLKVFMASCWTSSDGLGFFAPSPP